MTCPKCGSNNVNVQMVTDTQLKDKHHGIIWWLFIGWWWVPIKWFCLTIPALLAKIFIPKRQRIKQKHRAVCVCQQCGHTWDA